MNGTAKMSGAVAIEVARKRTSRLLWPELILALAATSITIGIIWDISWHLTIGRDTFWTPAHMAIYLGGVLGGCTGGYLAIKHTFFASAEERSASIQVLGARAPLGAWVAIWGAIAMVTSAPFDDWWHNAYGLDVKIISPPHMVLGLGMLGICLGAMLLAVSRQNREPESSGGSLFIFTNGIFLTLGAIMLMEFSVPNLQHAATFYRVAGLMFGMRLAMVSRAGRMSLPATRATLVYLGLACLMIWILPLFPAQPKLAPIFNPVTHMVPPLFPLLLFFPALGMDYFVAWLRERDQGFWHGILLGFVLGAIFLAILLPAQWFFSEFLLSPASQNWFFAGNQHWGYGARMDTWRTQFWHLDPNEANFDVLGAKSLLRCWVYASVSAWFGLRWGRWMRKVKR